MEHKSTFDDITRRYCLHQYVFTAIEGDNILEILFGNNPAVVREVCTFSGISDRTIVTAKASLPELTGPSTKARKVYLYNQANFSEIINPVELKHDTFA